MAVAVAVAVGPYVVEREQLLIAVPVVDVEHRLSEMIGNGDRTQDRSSDADGTRCLIQAGDAGHYRPDDPVRLGVAGVETSYVEVLIVPGAP